MYYKFPYPKYKLVEELFWALCLYEIRPVRENTGWHQRAVLKALLISQRWSDKDGNLNLAYGNFGWVQICPDDKRTSPI
jgi:hypothetical protein